MLDQYCAQYKQGFWSSLFTKSLHLWWQTVAIHAVDVSDDRIAFLKISDNWCIIKKKHYLSFGRERNESSGWPAHIECDNKISNSKWIDLCVIFSSILMKVLVYGWLAFQEQRSTMTDQHWHVVILLITTGSVVTGRAKTAVLLTR